MDIQTFVSASRGDRPVDLVLKNARVVNVFSGNINTMDIGIFDGRIAGFGDYEAKETLDLKGRYVAPGFIDAHVHIESSMACVSAFARAVVVNGTTTVVADPHEIANIAGTEGIAYMLDSARHQPMDIYYSLPSCVPATNMETSGAILGASDLKPFFNHERILALAEVMNFPGVVYGDPDMMEKLEAARHAGIVMDGHAPGLSGQLLYAYASTGISSDHECTTAADALEKLEVGMFIMVREGTCAKNLDALFPAISEKTCHRMMWCTDDRHPHDLMDDGHIDAIIRRAVKKGLDPITAIRMGTLNPARYFGLSDTGAVAPGRKANLVVFSDLHDIRCEKVFHLGKTVARGGKMLLEATLQDREGAPNIMNVDPAKLDFSIPAKSDRIRVIHVVPDQVVTGCVIEKTKQENGFVVSDVQKDILKIAVIDRYSGKCKTGKGFIKGIGLEKGAIASSVAHDSHNIIVVGVSDREMTAAVKAVVDMGGGFSVVLDQKPMARLPLPVAGLMSFDSIESVRKSFDHVVGAAKKLGSSLGDPFMTLGFIALAVIPELKITDKGLVDVNKFKLVSVFADE